ncbi:MAG: DNA-3-methyladenine glycosylase family protein [Candidatus Micrarchaeales archaeon]
MGKIKVSEFNMQYTVESAQPPTFFGSISKNAKSITYPTKTAQIEVNQHSDYLSYKSVPKKSDSALNKEVMERFGLHDDMERIYREIATDKFIVESIAKYPGMRVTKNEPWETTVCFITSQFNNVKRIRGIVGKLVENYGELHSVEVGGEWQSFRSFPTPEALAGISVKEMMKKCGTGFRAKYIIGSARMCAESFDLNKLHKKDYVSAKEELMELPGIGDKVADCILLMGYKKHEAFPVDTWIKRIVERVYFNGRKQSIKTIHKFADERWPKNQGYAQQYIFWHGRSLKLS